MNLRRLIALIIKEALTLFRDPKGRMVLIMPPLLQLLVFAFAATLEVKNVDLVLYNQDTGRHGIELLHRLAASSTFEELTFVDSVDAMHAYIDEQKAIAAIHIPRDFSQDLESGRQTDVQIILDGRKSNAAQIVNGYLSELLNTYGRQVQLIRGETGPPLTVVGRNWFNENLRYLWFTVPSLVAILSMMITLVVTAMSVARERELGTFDQLLVSPLTPLEILIGKTVPAVLIGLGEGLLIWTVAVTIFGIPFTGSFLLLLMALLVFIVSTVGVGLFISALSKTQQQAVLGTFLFMVPAVTLSGYASPIENMPEWLQRCTWVNPLRHILVTIKGLFLKDMPFIDVWANTWPLLVIGFVCLSFAGWFFTQRLE